MRPTQLPKGRKEKIMNTTKSNVRFTINFFEQTITGTKASFNKAGKGFGPEYEELTSKMAAHPGFALVVKEQKQKTTKAKKTYEGLDFTFMENYLATLANAEEISKKYKEVKAMAKKSHLQPQNRNGRAEGRHHFCGPASDRRSSLIKKGKMEVNKNGKVQV